MDGDRALKGEVCARPGCINFPNYQCPTCGIHYCHEHVDSHKHYLSEEEIEKDEENKQILDKHESDLCSFIMW